MDPCTAKQQRITLKYVKSADHFCLATAGLTTVVLVGGFLNLLALHVLSRKCMRSSGMNAFLIALICSDTLYLVSLWCNQSLWPILYFFWSETRTLPITLINLANYTRFFSYPIMRTTYTGSIWFLVVISIERFFAIWDPIRHRVATRRACRLYVIIVLVCCFAIALNLPSIFEFRYSDHNISQRDGNLTILTNKTQVRILATKHRDAINMYNLIVRCSLHVLVPFVCLCFFNGATLHKIRKTRAEQQQLQASHRCEVKNALMILNYSQVFCILHLVPTFQYVFDNFFSSYQCEAAKFFMVVRDICHILLAINTSVTFVVYYRYGSKFRESFKHEFQFLRNSHFSSMRLDSDDILRTTTPRINKTSSPPPSNGLIIANKREKNYGGCSDETEPLQMNHSRVLLTVHREGFLDTVLIDRNLNNSEVEEEV